MEQLPIIDPPPPPRRVSRDEMNLAEFPLTVLSTRPLTGKKTLEFSDTVRGRNGEVVNRQWIITGADKFGLPTSSDDEVLLGLLKLTVNTGFLDPKIYFSRYELLKILRWTTEGRSYSRLQKALDRLSGVRIKATNAFYDNETKAHSTRNFGIIDAYEINDGREEGAKPSFFIWSEVLFKSYQAGFIKKFDLDFYLGLKSAVSKRLYRYLDKHFWYRAKVQINLFTLAHEKLGVSRNYQFASSLKQQLDPAFEELREVGFLARSEYQGKGHETEVLLYAGIGKGRALTPENRVADRPAYQRVEHSDVGKGHSAAVPTVSVPPNTVTDCFEQNSAAQMFGATSETMCEKQSLKPGRATALALGKEPESGIEWNASLRERVKEDLAARGLKAWQASRFVEGKSDETISRIDRIIQYYDSLCQSGSYLVSRSPIGFLYRAVENPDNFVLPEERKQSAQATFPFSKREIGSRERPRRPVAANPVRDSQQLRAQREEAEYLVFRKKEIKKIRESAEASMLNAIQSEVEAALYKLRGALSETRFREMIEVGVDEKLAKLFALPTLDEWLREQSNCQSSAI